MDHGDAAVEAIVRFFSGDVAIAVGTHTAEGGGMTAREREVLVLLASGSSNGEVAAGLGISVHTVERHVANVYRTIDARGRADATAWAMRRGLL